ncbi:beta strand repeat-containing protein [Algoriphagus machipongonensis]|uniref:Glycine-rich domain-containing protein n=1 Tax=Algoriphagus machipongonensis TaxID=388413 RepID=E2RUD2_9BACT|nr:T9SS type A sorting domain-containing protein [Algoriphagus machipongonensis]EFQ79279.1 hypothetical protein ALPR1_21227 [Algoriphagus machipongonensis]
MSRNLPVSILLFLLIFVGWDSFAQTHTVTLTSPASGNFTVPDKITSLNVQLWGAGGGGGFNSQNNRPAGGGGGGGYSASPSYIVAPGQIISITIGAGGSGATSSSASTNGGNSVFGTLTANGGGRGNVLTGGTGGTATGGTLNNTGGNSSNAVNGNNNGGSGGGGGAGPTGNGGLGASSNNTTGGAGGTANGAGPGGKGGDNNAAGSNGISPGGGGGGEGGDGARGGNGGDGQISITWACSNTLTSAANSSNQTVCNGTPINDITYEIIGAFGATFSGLPSGVTGNYSGGDVTISGTPTVSGVFNYTITPTGSCTGSTVTGTINVTANQTVGPASSTPTLCIDDPLTDITHTTTDATGIDGDGVDGANGLPAGLSATWAGNTITISGTPSESGSFNYSIPVEGCQGSGVNATGTINVTANQTVGPASNTPTLCIDDPLTDITHTTTDATGIDSDGVDGANGLPAGLSATWAGNTITISGTPSESGSFNYSIPVEGCQGSGVNATGTINVTANQTVGPASNTPTLCIDDPLTDITHTTTDATGIDSDGVDGANGLPAGLSATWAGNTITISGTPSESGSFNYSIPVEGCQGSGVNATGTINVTANQTVGPASSNPTLCTDDPLTDITHTTTDAIGIDSDGVDGANGLPAGLSATWAGNTITISGTPSESGSFNYSIPVQGCLSSGVNATGTITVNPATSIDSESLDSQSACIGQTSFSPISVSASGTGTLSYQWYSNSNPLNSGGTPVGTDSPSYVPDASTLGTLYYYVEVSSDCGPTVTSNISGAFIVDPITAITTQPDNTDRVECFGDGFNPLSVVAEGGDLSYQWYSVPTQTNTGGTAVSGATSDTFTPPSTTEGISYYYVVVTGNCGIETSTVSGEFRVNPPKTVIDIDPSNSDETECLGDPFPTLSVLASGEGTVTYQWYRNTSDSNTGGTLISGANSEDYTPLSDEVGTYYYYAVASSNCGTVHTAVSGAFTVTPPTSIDSEDLAGQTICDVDTFDPISVNAIGTGTLQYQWYSNTSASTTGPNVTAVGTDSDTFTPPTTAQGTTMYYFVEVSSACGTNVISNPSGAFTVSMDNTAAAPSSDPTVCINTALPSVTIATTGATGIANDGDNSGVNGLPAGVSATWAGDEITISGTPSVSGTFNYSIPLTGGCGIVEATGKITVTPDNIADAPSSTPTLCINNALTSITIGTTGATGIANDGDASGVNGLPAGVSATWSGDEITISGSPSESGTFNYSIPMTGGCGTVNATGTITVTPDNTAAAPSSNPTLCIGTSLTDITIATTGATGIANDGDNTGVNGLPAGVSATWAGNTITISGTPTVSGTFNYAIPLTGSCGTVNATGTIEVTPLATVGPPSVSFPSVCINSPTLTPFTQPTTGVTGIGAPTGLPSGVTATFNSSTGNIEFSGEVSTAATGLYTYSIPLTGSCINGLTATGTIDVTPVYNITSISSVSATTLGGAATVTFYGDPTQMLNGSYQLFYQIKQGSGAFSAPIAATATVVNGKGTFTTTPINSNVDTYTVQILSIKKSTDQCLITLPSPPTTYFGVCSAVFTSNSTFFVPANVYSVTIEVYGGGGGGDNGGGGGGGYSIRQNVPVTPGEPLAAIIGSGGTKGADGGVTYVTRDSNIANQLTNSLVLANGGKGATTGNAAGGTFDSRYSGSDGNSASGNTGGKGGGPLGGNGGANKSNGNSPGGGGGAWSGTKGVGGNGLVVISYSCPDADNTDCIKIIDDGTKSGTTVVEYTCDDTWVAPEGLAEFTVLVGSGGGGGGGGEGSGGGGSGTLIIQSFSTTNPYGLPAGTGFDIVVGEGGPGAPALNLNGFSGQPSSFSGTIDNIGIGIIVPGGGGGGSRSYTPGADGASGGGGGADNDPNDPDAGTFGLGGNPIPISYSGPNVTVYQGNTGGSGDFSKPQNSIAGGGGGGLVPWGNGNDGQNGKAAGNGQGEGGKGGDGIVLTLGDSTRYYGAGGGGIGEFFNGTDKIGLGGNADGIKIGGDGNLNSTTAIGGQGIDKTGSGGGAGYGGGGRGGNGVVYIVYVNQRILQVEYQSFEVSFNAEDRTGDLSWTTSQEWENSHFEIERAVNNTNNWEKIGEVKGQGYAELPTSYSYIDQNLPTTGGNVFYRLKQVDYDETYSYSVTRSIQVPGLKGKTKWIIYPNPSANGSQVTVGLLNTSVYNDEAIYIRITDARGVLSTYSVNSIDDVTSAVNSYLENAISGLHIVQLIWGDQSEQIKLIRK